MREDIDFCGRQYQGARAGQEDYSVFSDPDGQETIDPSGQRGLLAVLADGMGGHVAGELASRLACDGFVEKFVEKDGADEENHLSQALRYANQKVSQTIAEQPNMSGMGTTLVAALVQSNQLRWISIGDSLLYHYTSGRLQRLNEDHSLAPELDKAAKEGEMTWEEARSHPDRNILRAAIIGDELSLIDEGSPSVEIRRGDWIVLASDGIQSLSKDEISQVISENQSADAIELANQLLSAVREKALPNQDNTTILAIRPTAATQPSTRPVKTAEVQETQPADKSTTRKTALLASLVLSAVSLVILAFFGLFLLSR